MGKKLLLLQPGYEAVRMVDDYNLHCRIEKGESGPEFVINCSNPPFSKRGYKCTDVVNATFDEIGYKPKKKWSGIEFFGLTMEEQTNLLDYGKYLSYEKENIAHSSPLPKVSSVEAAHPLVKKVLNNAHRNAGPTSTLNPPAQKSRNQIIVDSSEALQSEVRKILKKSTPRVEVSPKTALELILGKVDLSQRGYENLRAIFNKTNIILPTWKDVMKHEKTVDVGTIEKYMCQPVSVVGSKQS